MLGGFTDHINEKLIYLKGAKLLIACSGGVDSVVLTRLCSEINLDIAIAHCNFNLRGKESDGDEVFVAKLAEELKIPFYTTHFDTKAYAQEHKLSIQMAARDLRYSWFEELKEEHSFHFVLTAHHADDNLETFLINMSRGSGLDGLIGIPEKNGIYVRPLLPFSRERILNWAQKKEWKWREDSSNQETKYVRNRLRHDVIPELKNTFPGFLENFKNSIEYLNQCALFIRNQTSLLRFELFDNLEPDPELVKVSLQVMSELENPETFVYFLFKEFGFTAWKDMVKLLDAQPGKQIFSKTHRLIKDRDYLLLTPIREEAPSRTYAIDEEERMVMFPLGVMNFKSVNDITYRSNNTIYVDKEKLKYPLCVRKWREGDYFYPLGMEGKKKLSKYFKDEKLSLLDKEKVWLLCSGEDIVWIINHRPDNRFKVTGQTQEILKIKIT